MHQSRLQAWRKAVKCTEHMSRLASTMLITNQIFPPPEIWSTASFSSSFYRYITFPLDLVLQVRVLLPPDVKPNLTLALSCHRCWAKLLRCLLLMLYNNNSFVASPCFVFSMHGKFSFFFDLPFNRKIMALFCSGKSYRIGWSEEVLNLPCDDSKVHWSRWFISLVIFLSESLGVITDNGSEGYGWSGEDESG